MTRLSWSRETSVESVEESVRASEAAVVKFGEAKQLLEDAEVAYDVDFTSFKEYLGLRIEAQQRALESDRAYLDRDKRRRLLRTMRTTSLTLKRSRWRRRSRVIRRRSSRTR